LRTFKILQFQLGPAFIDNIGGFFGLFSPRMRIDKSLHKTNGLGGIGLIQLHLGRLLIKSIRPHIIHFLSLRAIGEYFYKPLKKILCIRVIPQIISAIREFIIEVFKPLGAFEYGKELFVQLLRIIVPFLFIKLIGHLQLVLIVLALLNFAEFGASRKKNAYYKQC